MCYTAPVTFVGPVRGHETAKCLYSQRFLAGWRSGSLEGSYPSDPGFESRTRYQFSGTSLDGKTLGLGPRDCGFDSRVPDHFWTIGSRW